mgnify:FL=1|jgi:hypothetical protein
MKRDMAIWALKTATAVRSPPEGSFVKRIGAANTIGMMTNTHGFKVSMGRKGGCYDDAPVARKVAETSTGNSTKTR